MELRTDSLVHCLEAGRLWPKHADKSASTPEANLFSVPQTASDTVKVIQKSDTKHNQHKKNQVIYQYH